MKSYKLLRVLFLLLLAPSIGHAQEFRLHQPPRANVLIEDPDHPDGSSVCQRISNLTRNPSQNTLAIAEHVVSVNSALLGETTQAYRHALTQGVYQLVTDWHGGECIAKLDVPGQRLIACSIDYLKHWRCRYGRQNEAELCYMNLCTGAAPASEAQ